MKRKTKEKISVYLCALVIGITIWMFTKETVPTYVLFIVLPIYALILKFGKILDIINYGMFLLIFFSFLPVRTGILQSLEQDMTIGTSSIVLEGNQKNIFFTYNNGAEIELKPDTKNIYTANELKFKNLVVKKAVLDGPCKGKVLYRIDYDVSKNPKINDTTNYSNSSGKVKRIVTRMFTKDKAIYSQEHPDSSSKADDSIGNCYERRHGTYLSYDDLSAYDYQHVISRFTLKEGEEFQNVHILANN